MSAASQSFNEEHELPSLEALLAATLALMTGYSQALQADLHPQQRLLMGAKIGKHLELMADHGGLSDAFHRIVLGLRARWQLMSACTAQAEPATSSERSCPPCAVSVRLH